MITNLRQVHSHHRRFLEQHEQLVDDAAEAAREQALHEVNTNPPFTPRSGNLQRSVDAKFVRTSRGAIVRISSNARVAPYNRAIEEGAKPHIMRSKGAMRFVWHGTVMFRRSIKHPGNRPYFFLRSATYAAAHAFETRMQLGMKRLAQRF